MKKVSDLHEIEHEHATKTHFRMKCFFQIQKGLLYTTKNQHIICLQGLFFGFDSINATVSQCFNRQVDLIFCFPISAIPQLSSTFDLILTSEKFQTMGKMRVGWFNVVQVSVSNTYIHFFPSMFTGPLVGSLGSLRSAPSARQFFFALHSTMKPVHMLT